MLAQLTTSDVVGILANRQTRSIIRRKDRFLDGTIIEIVIWELPEPVPASTHRYKYRLFFGVPGQRLIGYDNERGKGDHRHCGGREEPYTFSGIDELLDDFARDVEAWRDRTAKNHDDPRQGS